MTPRSLRLVLLLISTAVPFAVSQTQTIPNPNGNGGSIVQVVTTDINGLPVTNTLPPNGGAAAPDPLDPAAGAPTTTPGVPAVPTTTPGVPAVPTTTALTTTQRVQTTTPGNLGPVQQPPATTPAGQGITTYQYTTVDALGQTTVIQDTFTPTYNTPSPQQTPMKGTVLSPNDFSAMIGTHTAGGPTNSVVSWRITPLGAGGVLVLSFGMVVGAFAVL